MLFVKCPEYLIRLFQESKPDLQKLNEIVLLVPSERRVIGEKLVAEIAFVYRTLSRLRQEIDEGDLVSVFQQGEQVFLREHPAVKSYTALLPKYASLYKQLNDLLPTTVPQTLESALQEFLKQ